MDIQKLLRWLILGVVILIAASLLGLLIDIGTALLKVALQVLVVVLVVALIVRFFGGSKSGPSAP